MKRSGYRGWVIFLVLGSGLCAFLPCFFHRTVVDHPYVNDVGYQWLPFASFIRECYASGCFPLWDSHNMCGMPFLAFPHTGALYLPWVLIHSIFQEYAGGGAVDVFVHLCIASLSAFALFRSIGRTGASSFCAAAAFAFSGYIFSNLGVPHTLHAGAWLPLWFAAAFAVISGAGILSFLALAALTSVMIYSGDFELFIYAMLGLGFESWMRRKEERCGARQILLLSASIGAGLVAAAPLLLPALELGARSIRSAGPFMPEVNYKLMALIPVYALFQLPQPSMAFPPNNGLDPFYLGAVFIIAAAASLKLSAYSRRRLLVFGLAAAYVILIYVPPFNRWGSLVPVLGDLVVPRRMWPVLTLFFLLAATHALDGWIKSKGSREGDETLSWTPGKGSGWFLVIFGLATLISLYRVRHGIETRIIFCIAALGAGAWLVARPGIAAKPPARLRSAAVAVLVVLDLYLLALSWLPMTDPAEFRLDRRAVRLLSDTATEGRYMIAAARGVVDPELPFNMGLRINADTIDTFIRVPPADHARRLARLYPSLLKYKDGSLVRYDQFAIRAPRNLDRSRTELLNRMNVRWIVSRKPVAIPGLELGPIAEQEGFFAYKNESAQPRAFISGAGGIQSVGVRSALPGRLELIPPSPRLSPLSDTGAELFISESWYPGWRAFTGGEELRIEKTEDAFRKLKLKGLHSIFMTYRPASFRIGLFAGMAGLSCLFLAAACKPLSMRPGKRE